MSTGKNLLIKLFVIFNKKRALLNEGKELCFREIIT